MKKNVWLTEVLKFTGMAAGTALSGIIISFGAAFLLGLLLRDQAGGWGGLAGIVIGLFFFFPAGVITGQVIFKLRHFKGSLPLGIAGVLMGVVLTIVLNYLLHINTDSNLLLIVLYTLTVLCGTAGYFLGRRRSSSSG